MDKNNDDTVLVIVSTIQQATGLATQNLVKNRSVTITPSQLPTTHRNTAAAQAYIDVQWMDLVPEGANVSNVLPFQPRLVS